MFDHLKTVYPLHSYVHQWTFTCVLLLWTLSACTAFSVDQTTFILDYPPPTLDPAALSSGDPSSTDASISGTITTTLDPSINNDFSEYWLLAAGAATVTELAAINIDETGDVTSTSATKTTETIPYLIAILNDVSFSSKTVEPYSFTNISLATVNAAACINNNGHDCFYRLSARSWGINDSYAVAYQNNGWILSAPSAREGFYIGNTTNVTVTMPTTTSTTSITSGYWHDGTAIQTNDGCNAATLDCDVEFYIDEDDSALRIRVNTNNAHANASSLGIASLAISSLGQFIEELPPDEAYLNNTHNLGFLVTANAYFLVRHADGRYSKLNVIETTELELNIIYTGTNYADADFATYPEFKRF